MIKANKGDRLRVINLLAKAFHDNQSVNYIVKQDKDRSARINALMAYSFDVCFQFGEVYLSDDKNACVLLLRSGTKGKSLYALWLDIKLIFKAIGLSRIGVALKRESLIKKFQIQVDHFYLWFIGVAPAHQHQGVGSKLLKEVLIRSDREGLPVCLETSVLKNLPWYQTFGFEIYNELDFNFRLYFLKRHT